MIDAAITPLSTVNLPFLMASGSDNSTFYRKSPVPDGIRQRYQCPHLQQYLPLYRIVVKKKSGRNSAGGNRRFSSPLKPRT